ncbi:MAG TPA: hypothetical protein VF629_18915 [Hymenobacter sp.]|jgi:hypothetical protein|uniref:hypothetical protein n=1 Tax=Hymenobacter sp. TaxID=1898978 RepID=UPI002EDB617F
MPALTHFLPGRGHSITYAGALLWALLAACQPQRESAATASPPPVGHYEGSLSVTGQPELRTALDIRHPSPGHYEAEFTVPNASTLSFVADTMLFSNNQLRLTRPARPNQTLTLTLDGDFWRGSLALDSTKATIILLKRGMPTPSTYRVEEVPQPNGTAWLFAPSDTGTLGTALALLPDAATAPAAALWADALAREGVIVLVLPAADSATAADEGPRVQAAVRLLRNTAGADTADVGAWAAGPRAAVLPQVLTAANAPRVAFAIAQNPELDAASQAALRELKNRKLPLLGLYGGPSATQRATALRNAFGGRRGITIRTYRAAGTDLFVGEGLSPRFATGLPMELMEWLRGR